MIMEIFPILMNGIFNFCGNNNSNLRSDAQILGQRYGTWHHETVKKRTPYLVLKARLRSGYGKTLSVVFV